MNLHRVFTVARREWREILRDRIFLLLAFFLPPVLMIVFGYGMNQDVERVPIAILDYDHSAWSREYSFRFINSRYFHFQGYLRHPSEAARMLDRSQARVILILPEQFHERLTAGNAPAVQVLVDGAFTIPIRTIRGYIEAINADVGGEIGVEFLSRRLGIRQDRAEALMQPIRADVRYLYNQEIRSAWTTAPLLIMLILTWTTPMLMALSVVREKETGAIYNTYASTVTRAEFLAGKLLPIVTVSALNAGILWIMATRYFEAPFKGSFGVFSLAALLFLLSTAGLGLLISLMVRTQQAALLVAVVGGTTVASQFSGMMTAIPDMTGAAWLIAHMFPAMYFTNVLEGTFLRGAGLSELWPDLVVLLLYSLGVLSLAHRFFHKRLRG